jgi:hypothetical protein
MPSNLTIADAALKVGYGDMHEQLDNRTVALSLLQKTSKHITKGNKEAQFGVRTRRSWGIGARNEYEDTPEALARKTVRASVFLKYHYGVIEGSGQTFKQVSSDPQAFVDWMDEEAKDILDTLKRDLNREFYGDGTGTLALLTSGATTATSIVVDTTLWLESGQPIDVLTQATLGNPTPTKGNTAKLIIESVDAATNTITVSGGTVTAAIGSAIVLAGATANNWKKEWEGLGLIISNSSVLHGINPATESTWKPGYIEASVGTLAEIDLTHLVARSPTSSPRRERSTPTGRRCRVCAVTTATTSSRAASPSPSSSPRSATCRSPRTGPLRREPSTRSTATRCSSTRSATGSGSTAPTASGCRWSRRTPSGRPSRSTRTSGSTVGTASAS